MSEGFIRETAAFLRVLGMGWLLFAPSYFWFYGLPGGCYALGNLFVCLAVGLLLPEAAEGRWRA